MRLTRRQQEILDFLRDNAQDFTHPPTLDELCAMLGLSSRGSLHKHVQALIASGFVEPMDGQHRGIRLIRDDPADDGIPFLGTIAAGRPIEAVPQPESVQVPPQLSTDKPCYVLKVRGDSMCEAGILDGDYVVIEQRETARIGVPLDLTMAMAGFCPQGGGELQARIPGGARLTPLKLTERGRACCFALGARGKRAERVADEAVDALAAFLRRDGAVDPWLADQLLLPLAMAEGASVLRIARSPCTCSPTPR